MKKFLTVLLALSVVFTYTVGTAFAASSDAYPAKERVKNVTLSVYADMKKLVDEDTVSGVKIDKAAWESTYTAYETKLLSDIEARYAEIVAKIDLTNSNEAAIYEMFFEQNNPNHYQAYTGDYKTSNLYVDKAGTVATVANSLVDKTYDDEAAFNADTLTKYDANGAVVNAFVADQGVSTMTVKVKNANVTWYEKATFTYTSDALPRTAYTMLTDFQTAEADAAARYQFNTEKAAALSVLANVNLSEFSTTVETINGVETSYNALAKKVVETATKTVNETTITSDAKIATVKTALDDIGEVARLPYDKTQNETAGTGALKAVAEKYDINGYATGSYVLSKEAKTANNLKTIEDQGGDAAKLEAKKAKLLSAVAAEAARYYESVVTTSGVTADKIAEAKALKDAYITAMTYVVNSATKESELISNAPTLNANDEYAKNVAAIAELEQYAAKCKAETDISGNLVRDAKLVDEAVAGYKLTAYKLTTLWDNGTPTGALAAAKDAIKKIKTAPAIDEYDRADQIAALETAYANLDLYDVELAKAKAEYDAKIAALKAATTAAEYTAAKAMNITTPRSKTLVEGDVAGLSAFSTETARLDAYINLLEAGQVGKANADKVDYSKFTTAYWKVFYAKNGARTNAEVTALFDKAKADIDATKTNGTLATEKNAAEAAIAALPAQITEANADAVKAAYAAAAAYAKDCKVADYTASDLSNKAKLTGDITKLANAERNAVLLAFDKLPVDALITDADKAAVKAVAESKAAFNKKIAEEDMYKDAGVTTESSVNTEAKLLKIRGLELAKVKAAIDAIPINVTLKDKATVEAARALVDAYIADYTTYDTKNIYGQKYDAAKFITNSEDLTSAEATIKVLDKEGKIKATESLKIKASSKLYKGKKIQVKWRIADGDASMIDGYQVYKSTKANSGYKFMGKTKKLSMDNKKNLKKGTRYFYKVRAYVDVDGTRYYSDWSNKANRIYKK